MKKDKKGLIGTINDEDEVPKLSDTSESESEFQPQKKKKKLGSEFNPDFTFVGSAEEYNKDTWDDVTKYIKKKAKTKTDDKIAQLRSERETEVSEESDEEADDDELQELDEEGDTRKKIKRKKKQLDEERLSEDELQNDVIRDREYKKKKKQKDEFFDDAPPFDEDASFFQMNISRPLMRAIGELKYTHPTPIQSATIPVGLEGRDICGCAATGTGKTAAYMLPILERLLYKPRAMPSTRVLVLVPTRELGVQVYQVAKQLAQFTDVTVGLSVGGLDVKTQEAELRKNPDIVIATPGRLIDHCENTPTFSLHNIEILVLDEADRMLDEYFAEQMKEIIRQCNVTRQTMLFSATMTDAVEDLAAVSLKKPVRIFVDSNQQVALTLRQEFIRIRDNKEGDRMAILAALVCRTFRDHTMVFVPIKHQVHKIRIQLGLLGLKVGELHGNLTQPQRMDALTRFKNEELDVLVATDVAARGLDIRGVKTVINYIAPRTLEHYIHRVGRTARAGRAGVSVSLVSDKDRWLVKEVMKCTKNPIKRRLVAQEIIEKYKCKIKAIEEDVDKIITEEKIERELAKADKQSMEAKKLLSGHKEEGPQRTYFNFTERNKEREKQKKALAAIPKDEDLEEPKGKKGKRKAAQPVNVAQKELERMAALHARHAKKNQRTKKLRSSRDHEDVRVKNNSRNNKSSKKKGSVFDHDANKRNKTSYLSDITEIGPKAVKRMRYEANVKQKMDNFLSKKKK